MSDNISPPTLFLLCRELKEISEWEELAIYLKLPDHIIQDAKERYPNGGIWNRKKHCLKKWLNQAKTVHSWRTVADAVEEVNARLAENIRKKYTKILDQVPSKKKSILLRTSKQKYAVDQVLTTSQNEEHSIVSNGQYFTSTHDPIINDHQFIALEQVPSTSSNDEQYPTSNSKIEEEEPLPIEKEIVEGITNLVDKFAMLVSRTQTSLERDPDNLLLLLRYLKESRVDVKTSPDEAQCIIYNRVFDILHTKWDFLKCGLLQRIIRNFLSDTELWVEVQKYRHEMIAFKESTKMKDLIDKIKQKIPSKVKVALKVKKMWLDVKLKHFEDLVKLVFEEYADSLYVISVNEGCMCVMWSVPEVIAFFMLTERLSRLENEMLKAIGVISLTVGNIVVFNNKDSQDDMTFDWLREQNEQRAFFPNSHNTLSFSSDIGLLITTFL